MAPEQILPCTSALAPSASDGSVNGAEAERDTSVELLLSEQRWGCGWSSEGAGGYAAQGMGFGSIYNIRLKNKKTLSYEPIIPPRQGSGGI